MTTTHTDAAYDWYNDSSRSKADFERYAAERGVVLFGDGCTHPDHDWADVVMSLFDMGISVKDCDVAASN